MGVKLVYSIMGSRRLRTFDKRMMKLFVSKGEKVTGDRRKLRKEFLILLLTKYYSGEQMKEDEMDGECCTYGGEENWIRSVGSEI
jgi:hypothetical protein